MSIQAMKQALEALEDDGVPGMENVKANLRAAIEAAERQEPVAWGLQMPNEKQPRQIWTVKDTAFQNAMARSPVSDYISGGVKELGDFRPLQVTTPQPAIPAGMVLVPVSMAGDTCPCCCQGSEDHSQAMLAAAPKLENSHD